MSRLRTLSRTLLLLALVLSLLAIALAVFLRSSFITQYLRRAITDGVGEATGARAEVGELQWSWRSLSLELRGFTMHGFEPASGPPLFTAPEIHVRLRILSLLNGQAQITSLIVHQPRFFLSVGPHGQTNIPGPRHPRTPQAIVQSLLDLKLAHAEAIGGFAQINETQLPVNFAADHIAVLVQYLTIEHAYRLSAQSPALHLGDPKRRFFNGFAQLHADVSRDHVSLTSAQFSSPAADLHVAGTLDRFNHPVVDWNLTSTLHLPELSALWNVSPLTQGVATITGTGHHDGQTPLFFDGAINASRLGARLPRLTIANAAFQTRFVADQSGLQLSDLLFSSPLGRFSGHGTLTDYRTLAVTGDLAGLSLKTLSTIASRAPLPWTATLSGPVTLAAQVRPQLANAHLDAALHLSPARDGIPVSGDAHLLYRQSVGPFWDDLSIPDAHLALPNTQLTLTGHPNELAATLDSADLGDLHPALALWTSLPPSTALPQLSPGGHAHLQAAIHRLANVQGSLEITRFQFQDIPVNSLQSTFIASAKALQLTSLTLHAPWLDAQGTASTELSNGTWTAQSNMQGKGSLTHADLPALLQFAAAHGGTALSPVALTTGTGAGTFAWTGPLANPQAHTTLTLHDLTAEGEHVETLALAAAIQSRQVTVTNGELRSASARLQFSGRYTPLLDTWSQGNLEVVLDSNRFPLSQTRGLFPSLQSLDAQVELHTKALLQLTREGFSPLALDGTTTLHQLQHGSRLLGNIEVSAHTENRTIRATLASMLVGAKLTGQADVQIAKGTPVRGTLRFSPVTLNNVIAAFGGTTPAASSLAGSANGDLSFEGPLATPRDLSAVLRIQNLEIKGPPLQQLGEELVGASPLPAPAAPSAEVLLRNTSPVTLELRNRLLTVRSADLAGRDTHLQVTGTAELSGAQKLNLDLQGGIDLRLLQIPFPDVQTGGQADLSLTLRGSLHDPQPSGNVRLANGRVYSAVLPNGLSDLTGSIHFDQHRATVQDVVARTGGGTIHFGGFVTYAANVPLVYRLDSTGQNIRIRYANGISITGNSQFSLTGTSRESLLSGGITISRVVLNPSTDIGNILALTSTPAVEVDSSKDYLSRLQMDIHMESAPNLQLDTALSSGIQADIDLQLRGTPKQPIFLGSIEANEGDIKVFGSRYSINRGQVTFNNPARLEPVLDLDLQTQSRGVTVDITVSGTLNRLNINYRSDPPLQPREIIALLTVGRAPQSTSSQSNVQATNDSSSLQSGANTVLGQAISPLSNRLSKLFGITNIKIDPLVQGITNTPQARLTLEQQISRQITVTYITNLSQTSEQIFRLEYALSSQFSVVALRDDNGEFGIDILYKKRFK